MAHRNPVENMGMGNLSNQFSMASRKNFISDINPGLKKSFNFVSSGLGGNVTKNKKGLLYDEEDVETSMYFQNHLYPYNSEKEYFSSTSPLTFGNNSTYQSQARNYPGKYPLNSTSNNINNMQNAFSSFSLNPFTGRTGNDAYFNQFRNNTSPTSYPASTPPSFYGSNFTPSAFFSHNSRPMSSQTVSQSTGGSSAYNKFSHSLSGSHHFGQNYTSAIGNNHNFSIIGKQRNLNTAFQQGSGIGTYSSSNYSNPKSGRTFNEGNPLALDLSEFPSLRQTNKGGTSAPSSGSAIGSNQTSAGGLGMHSAFENGPFMFPLGNLMNGVVNNGPGPQGLMGLGSSNATAAAIMAAQQLGGFGTGGPNNLASALKGVPPYGMVKQSASESQQEFQMHSEDFPALPGPQSQSSSLVKDALNLFDYNASLSAPTANPSFGDGSNKLTNQQYQEQQGAGGLGSSEATGISSSSLPDHASLMAAAATAIKRGNFSSASNVRSLFPTSDPLGDFTPDATSITDARNQFLNAQSSSVHHKTAGPFSATNLRSNSTPLIEATTPASAPTSIFFKESEDYNSSSVSGGENRRQSRNGNLTGPDYPKPLGGGGGNMAHGQGVQPQAAATAPSHGIVTHPDGRVTNIPPSMVTGPYGMVGLLAFIRTAEFEPNLVQLGLGSDLTTFGLNLNSSDPIYMTFAGPFSETACKPHEIEYTVPNEYLIGSQIKDKLPSPQMSKVGEDMLFFVFYAFTNDVLQLVAAQELYNRDWRFHLDERVWLTKIPGMHTSEKTPSYERGTYYFFDPQSWRKVPKEFLIYYNKLEDRPVMPAPSTSSSAPINNSSKGPASSINYNNNAINNSNNNNNGINSNNNNNNSTTHHQNPFVSAHQFPPFSLLTPSLPQPNLPPTFHSHHNSGRNMNNTSANQLA